MFAVNLPTPWGQQVCEVSVVFSDLYLGGSGLQFRCTPPWPKVGSPWHRVLSEKVTFLKNGWPPQ